MRRGVIKLSQSKQKTIKKRTAYPGRWFLGMPSNFDPIRWSRVSPDPWPKRWGLSVMLQPKHNKNAYILKLPPNMEPKHTQNKVSLFQFWGQWLKGTYTSCVRGSKIYTICIANHKLVQLSNLYTIFVIGLNLSMGIFRKSEIVLAINLNP